MILINNIYLRFEKGNQYVPCSSFFISNDSILAFILLHSKWGVMKIHLISVIASQEGVEAIAKDHPDVQVTVGTIDQELSSEGLVLPGIGDAGDRLFGTPMITDGEALLHPSKRRKMSMDEK